MLEVKSDDTNKVEREGLYLDVCVMQMNANQRLLCHVIVVQECLTSGKWYSNRALLPESFLNKVRCIYSFTHITNLLNRP